MLGVVHTKLPSRGDIWARSRREKKSRRREKPIESVLYIHSECHIYHCKNFRLIQHDDVCCFHENLKLPWYSVAKKKGWTGSNRKKGRDISPKFYFLKTWADRRFLAIGGKRCWLLLLFHCARLDLRILILFCGGVYSILLLHQLLFMHCSSLSTFSENFFGAHYHVLSDIGLMDVGIWYLCMGPSLLYELFCMAVRLVWIVMNCCHTSLVDMV